MTAADDFNVSEYKAFGPWVYEITDKYPMPRIFAPFFEEDDDAVMKIKIPREIEHRNAAPGMELYDFVIALYEDQLRVLNAGMMKWKDTVSVRKTVWAYVSIRICF